MMGNGRLRSVLGSPYNPALLQHPNGQYWLYYKAWDRYVLEGRPAYLFLSLKGGKYDKSSGVVLKIDPKIF